MKSENKLSHNSHDCVAKVSLAIYAKVNTCMWVVKPHPISKPLLLHTLLSDKQQQSNHLSKAQSKLYTIRKALLNQWVC